MEGEQNNQGNPVAPQIELVLAGQRHREREPPIFYGRAGEDVVHWISKFERVAGYNLWDPARKFSHLGMCLEDVALEWFMSLVPQPQTYDELRTALLTAFRDPNYEYDLESKLRNRFQGVDEPVMTYCYNVVYLCSKLDPDMPEQTKVRHLLRGLKPSLLEKVYPLVEHGVTNTQTLFQLVQRHSQASHLANNSDWSSKILPPTPCMFVTQEQLQKAITGVERKVEQVESKMDAQLKNVQSQIEGSATSVIQAVSDMFKNNAQTNTRQDNTFDNQSTFKRTHEGKPICNRCNRPGHIARNCQTKQNFSKERRCFKCGDTKHLANACSRNPATSPNSDPTNKSSN